MVQFKVGEDKETVAGQSSTTAYWASATVLPAEAGTPLIRSVDVDDVPVVTVTLASEKYDDFALKRLADRMVEGLRSQDYGVRQPTSRAAATARYASSWTLSGCRLSA
jgi:multidrug efflux pump subunit AcrB